MLDLPILCLYGGASLLARDLATVRLALPQAHTVVMPGERHSILMDRPAAVREAVLSWLRSQCGLPVSADLSHSEFNPVSGV
jgi:pimeloyl-ACP methyl ester carboxylesterase